MGLKLLDHHTLSVEMELGLGKKNFSLGFGLMNNFKEWPVNSISHQLSCV